MSRILIIDDDPDFRESLAETLTDLGHDPFIATGAAAGLRLLARERIDGVILDFRMPQTDGVELLRAIRARPEHADLPVAMLTAHASAANTIAAMRLGAVDHLTKPVGRTDIEDLINRMAARPRSDATASAAEDDPLVGVSPAMRAVQKLIGICAASEATVLVTGETGTGKEIVARSIHAYSPRSAGPLIAVNCAAIPPALLESELFGHVRGAFTGAIRDRAGCFREAARGSLFLDEIGDMDLAMQAKLLRVLEDRRVTPVGSDRSELVDVRLIAATHRKLHERVAEGRFREDLYYRLNVLEIPLPPLRDRRQDIVLLAEHFLRLFGSSGASLSLPAGERLVRHHWPGNVRELKNAIERALMLARGGALDARDFDFLASDSAAPDSLAGLLDGELAPALEALERLMIQRAMDQTNGNRAAAARRLGIHRQLLYTKLKRYGLDT